MQNRICFKTLYIDTYKWKASMSCSIYFFNEFKANLKTNLQLAIFKYLCNFAGSHLRFDLEQGKIENETWPLRPQQKELATVKGKEISREHTHNELLSFCGRDWQKDMEKETRSLRWKCGACLARESKTKLNCQGNKSKDMYFSQAA